MVKTPYHLAQSLFEDAKIDEHPALAQAPSRCPCPHPVIVSMQALTLAVVMNKPVRRRKPSLNPHIVHRYDNIDSRSN